MIFTIGKTINYERFFLEQDQPQKLGRCKRSPGGSVWRTFNEVQTYLDSLGLDEYSIYGVIADWEEDTEQHGGASWRDLLKNSDLIKLDK